MLEKSIQLTDREGGIGVLGVTLNLLMRRGG
jgi:hypothetical protein